MKVALRQTLNRSDNRDCRVFIFYFESQVFRTCILTVIEFDQDVYLAIIINERIESIVHIFKNQILPHF